MLARIRKSMEQKDQGFTLIELLVVMIIIGILAAIAIPVFLNQRKKARETSAKADATTVGKELAAYYVDGKQNVSITSDATTLVWTATPSLAGATADPTFTGKLSTGNQAKGAGTTSGQW
ncbi:MAG: type II secretion system protein, partial [Actinomycetes bacterium]